MTAPTALPPAESQPEPERIGKYAHPREAVVDLLRTRLEARLQDVEGGPWDGVRVVTAKDLAEALSDPLPPPSINSAEVETLGYIGAELARQASDAR